MTRHQAEDIADGGPLGGGPDKLVERIEEALDDDLAVSRQEAYDEGMANEREHLESMGWKPPIDPVGDEPRPAEADVQCVELFARDMVDKLRQNAHKAHWSTVTQKWLMGRLMTEAGELKSAMGGDTDAIIAECADVANFAMMIADNARQGIGR